MDPVLDEILFGSDFKPSAGVTKSETEKPLPDPLGDFLDKANFDFLMRPNLATTSLAKSTEWNEPVGGALFTKRVRNDALPSLRGTGVRTEKRAVPGTNSVWVMEYDAAGSLICGYLEEEAA